jgi:hypothetical protein
MRKYFRASNGPIPMITISCKPKTFSESESINIHKCAAYVWNDDNIMTLCTHQSHITSQTSKTNFYKSDSILGVFPLKNTKQVWVSEGAHQKREPIGWLTAEAKHDGVHARMLHQVQQQVHQVKQDNITPHCHVLKPCKWAAMHQMILSLVYLIGNSTDWVSDDRTPTQIFMLNKSHGFRIRIYYFCCSIRIHLS